MHVIRHHTPEQLQALRRKSPGVLRDHIQMVILAMQGRTAPEIADAVGSSRRTVQYWVYRYNAKGMDGLKDARGGNHRLLMVAQEKQIVCVCGNRSPKPSRKLSLSISSRKK